MLIRHRPTQFLLKVGQQGRLVIGAWGVLRNKIVIYINARRVGNAERGAQQKSRPEKWCPKWKWLFCEGKVAHVIVV